MIFQALGVVPSTSSITVLTGGTLALDDNNQNLFTNRITAPVILSGGNLTFTGNNAPNANSGETISNLTLVAGNSTINSVAGLGYGANSKNVISNLSRTAGATVNFVGTTYGLASVFNQIVVNGTGLSSGLVGSNTSNNLPYQIVPWATVTNRRHRPGLCHGRRQWRRGQSELCDQHCRCRG